MTGCQVIQLALETTRDQLLWYIGDLSDADLLVRPVPGANHAAWQIGNVIGGDIFFVKAEFPDVVFPDLPEGFMALHGPDGAKQDTPDGFLTKEQYVKHFQEVRAVTIATAAKLTDADLDRPSGEKMRAWAPTLAHVFLMAANHTLMHGGQFSVIRRKLGKPVLF